MQMNHTVLIDLIDRIISNLQLDYSLIKEYTKVVQIYNKDMHLDWSLAHMNTSLLEFLRDLERHQKYLQKDIDGETVSKYDG